MIICKTMNKTFFGCTGIVLIVFLLTCCGTDNTPQHFIRVKNKFGEVIADIKVGGTEFGKLGQGKTSEYKLVSTVDFNMLKVEVTTPTSTLTGKVIIKGNGTHRYTLVISIHGETEITEDFETKKR
jgi:hypothetical protein